MLGFKTAVLSAAIIFREDYYVWTAAVFVGAAFVFFVMTVYSGKTEKSGRIIRAITAVFMIIAAASFTGCGEGSEEPLKKPEIKESVKLKFVPSVLLAVSGNKLYVGSERQTRVFLYNMKTQKIEDTIVTGMYPYDMILDDGKLYIANNRGANVTIYDIKEQQTVDIRTRGTYPAAVALSGDKKKLYAANMGSSNVSVIDLEKKESVRRVGTGKWPSGLYMDEEGVYLYVACKYTNTIEIIDTRTDELILTKIDAGISPADLMPINKTDILVISEWEYSYNQKSSIVVMDKRDFSIKRTIMTEGGAPAGIVSKSRKYIYLAIPLKDMVVFMDYESGKEVHRIVFEDRMPRWMSLSPDGKSLYVTTQKDRMIHRIALNGMI